jgi:hypothetical protein
MLFGLSRVFLSALQFFGLGDNFQSARNRRRQDPFAFRHVGFGFQHIGQQWATVLDVAVGTNVLPSGHGRPMRLILPEPVHSRTEGYMVQTLFDCPVYPRPQVRVLYSGESTMFQGFGKKAAGRIFSVKDSICPPRNGAKLFRDCTKDRLRTTGTSLAMRWHRP